MNLTPPGPNEPRNEPSKHDDVRMRGFAKRVTVEQAIERVDRLITPLADETVPLAEAAGRTLAVPIVSGVDVPGFERAMMDGYAVVAQDIEGASTYNPLSLQVVGQILPGVPFDRRLGSREAVRIMTGAPVPDGADAVLPAEKTEIQGDEILVNEAVPHRKHIGPQGEDIRVGDTLLSAGRRLRAQDIGVLSSIGVDVVPVIRRPRVRVVITGNELLPSGSRPYGCMISDTNGPMLAALIERDGGVLTSREIVPDTPDQILIAMQDDVDIVLISGGSSVGIEDFAPNILSQHGTVEFHGVAMRPSSPSGMGTLGRRLVFLLPGNPVSCLCSYDFFAGRAIRGFGGRDTDWPHRTVRLRLNRKLVSQIGRVDYARVRIVGDSVDPIAVAGASLLSSTTRADGFVIIPADDEGYAPGQEVKVFRYE